MPAMTKPKIVFLDAGTVDWGDQNFSPLKKIGSLKQHYSTSPAQTIQRVKGFQHVVLNKVVFDRKTLRALNGVRGLHLSATGFNNIDLDAAKEYGIAVTNVRGYSTESVLQLTFTLLLALASRLKEYDQAVQAGKWSRQDFFALTQFPFFELAGKTLGIVGYGTIGRRVAETARVFGTKVMIAQIPGRVYSAKEAQGRTALKEVLKRSDFVTIHAPLSDATRGLIGAKEIALMKKSAFLLNLARGGIIDEKALAAALKAKKIAGAATDVLTQEPPPRTHVLYNAPRLILTPHIAWASTEARTRVVEEIARNIISYEENGNRNRLV